MKRRAFLNAINTSSLGFFCALGLQGTAQAKDKKKNKLPDFRKNDTNRDGRNTVDGAVWDLNATKVSTGQQISFRYRSTNYVLYDISTSKVIGKTEKIKDNHASVTLNEGTPFAGTFHIKNKASGHWIGQMNRDGADWVIKLTCLDR